MRTRTIVAVLAAAVVLGVLTGRFVLPARPHAAPPAAAPAAPPPQPASGPVTERNLVTAADVAAAGVTRRVYVRDRVGDGAYANAACAGEKTLGETLGGPGAHFRGLLATAGAGPADPTLAADSADQVAREVAADTLSRALARNFTERLLLEEVPCQSEPAGHWVYGPTHTVAVAADVSASWLGTYAGGLNTTGAAPRGVEPCGGIAVLRSGTHYGVLEVTACLGTAAMTRLVRTAVTRL